MSLDAEMIIQLDQLGHPIDNKNLSESLCSDKCDYVDIDECMNLNPNNYNMNILQQILGAYYNINMS